MDDHLTTERISALIERPGAHSAATEHLEECPRCSAEYETMLRMRMTLSALGDCEPPDDEWERLEARLEDEGLISHRRGNATQTGGGTGAPGGASLGGLAGLWPVRAAAALVLFAGGIAAGLEIGSGGGAPGAAGVAGQEAASEPATALASRGGKADGAGESAYPWGLDSDVARRVRQYLVSNETSNADPVEDPVGAVEEMATLDALSQAVREALQERPADPTLNDLLFRLTERRENLTSGFGQAAHLVTLDYR